MSVRREQSAPKVGVLFVHTATIPPLGADTWIQAQIISALDRAGHDVHVACATGSAETPTPTFELLRKVPQLHIVPVSFGRERRSAGSGVAQCLGVVAMLVSLVRLAGYVRRNGIAVIHTSDRPRDALCSVLLARLTSAKSVIHSHVAFGDWMSPVLRWSLAHADARVAVSRFVAASLVAGGCPSRGTYTVLNAIEVERWTPGVDRDAGRRELGVDPEVPVIVTVCRLFPAKGPGELIRALPEVRRVVPGAVLAIVGDDLVQGGGYTQELRALADELGLGEAVIMTGRRADVIRLMAAADVFAMPSIEEPFGLVYLEAMAMELPVVALTSGGAPEVIDDGRSGLLCRPGDVDELAANLIALLEDPSLRRRMGEYGRCRVQQCFTIRRMARDVAGVYRDLLSSETREPELNCSRTCRSPLRMTSGG